MKFISQTIVFRKSWSVLECLTFELFKFLFQSLVLPLKIDSHLTWLEQRKLSLDPSSSSNTAAGEIRCKIMLYGSRKLHGEIEF